MDSCVIDGQLAQRLGFKRIFTAGKEMKLTNIDDPKVKGVSGGIIAGADKAKLLNCARGDVKAIIVTDSRIDKKLIEHMANNDLVLCIPLSSITSSYGLGRQRTIYLTKKLFTYARKSKIEVSFITLARSPMYQTSSAQLIALAMLLGADEQYARRSISAVTKGLFK